MFEELKKYLAVKTNLSDAQFEAIAAGLSGKTVSKGTILLRQDEVCSEVFFVSKGLLRAYTVDNEGKEHVIQFAPENWWISDRNSFYFNEPALFFIDATEDSGLVVCDKAFFEKAAAFPAFNEFNIIALHNQIRLLQVRLNMLMGASAEERYLDFVKRYPNLTLRVPQWMIASYLGITPESLSRVRRELAKRNFKPY